MGCHKSACGGAKGILMSAVNYPERAGWRMEKRAGVKRRRFGARHITQWRIGVLLDVRGED